MASMTLEEYITSYIKLRDKRDAVKLEQKKVLKQYKDALDMIAGELHKHLRTNNLQRIATDQGTAFIKTTRSATVADMSLFRAEVISNSNFDLADFRANVNAVEAYLEANKTLPSGVNFSKLEEVGVQRS
jgi:hypothetical protein